MNDIVVDIANNNIEAVQKYIKDGHALDHNSLAFRTCVYVNNIECAKILLPHSDIFADQFNGIDLAIYNNRQDIFDLMIPYITQHNDQTLNQWLLLRSIMNDRVRMVEQILPLCQPPKIDTGWVARNSPSLIRLVLEQTSTNAVEVAVECVSVGNKAGFDAAFDYADLHDLKQALMKSSTLYSKEFFNEACVQIDTAIEALTQKQHLEHQITNIAHKKTGKTHKSKI